MLGRFVSTAELAARTGISRATAWRVCAHNPGFAVRAGGTYWIPESPDDVAEVLNNAGDITAFQAVTVHIADKRSRLLREGANHAPRLDLGSEAAMFQGISVALRSAATRAMHSADATAPHGR